MGRVEKTYTVHPAFRVFVVLELAAVVLAAIFYLPPAANFALPAWARMIIFHVPCAMVAVVAYVVSTAYAIAYLARGGAGNDIKSAASASLGFVFTILATVTGMIFAQKEWGTAWNWDPRETSILMLLIVYSAYFALRGSIPNLSARSRICAAYNILACLVMPFFVFVMPRIGPSSLHPKSASLSREYLTVLGGAMLGYLLAYLWAFRSTVAKKELQSARGRKKVGQL